MARRSALRMTAAAAQAHQQHHGFAQPDKPRGEQQKTAVRRGRMNKTEAAFALLLEARKRFGEITAYHFEGITLRWGANPKNGEEMRYTPDFIVRGANGVTYLVEIKGGHIFSRDLVRFKGVRAEWSQTFKFEFEMWQRKAGEFRQIQ